MDTTIFLLPRVQGGFDTIWTSTDTYDFGTMYVDSFKPGIVTQPKSGAANISQTYFHARTFMSLPPTRPLRCLWEPGYLAITGMDSLILDTVWINGSDTLGGTDEWDDDILLHEFGHYVMDFYAQKPKSDTGGHAWPISYPERPGLAYGEGWAEFFSCRARVGSGTDSLIINTAKGIGDDSVYLWHNIENPWLGEFDTTWFMGDPWCEGAVAGALWDIYDSKNEIPYHSYPLLPQFPDTGLRDTLTMGFDEIWNVFDNFNPPGNPTNCWTIFDFRSGWNYYNYGYPVFLNQILLHHRIRDSIPAAPVGLTVSRELNNVRLYWRKNTESDLDGYRIYRKAKRDIPFPPGAWPTQWSIQAQNDSPADTTYLDNTVVLGYSYRYRVTAFDTLNNESIPSDSVQIKMEQGQGNPDELPLIVNMQTIITNNENQELCITSYVNVDALLKIYDCGGRLISNKSVRLPSHESTKINYTKDSKTNDLATGVYFLHIKTGDMVTIKKFVIIK